MQGKAAPSWLGMDTVALRGSILGEPTREDIAIPLNEQLIVEYYSR